MNSLVRLAAVVCLLTAIGGSVRAQDLTGPIVGYVRAKWDDLLTDPNRMDTVYANVTHINWIGGVGVKSDGTFKYFVNSSEARLIEAVNAAHAHGKKISFTIGGGSVISSIMASPAKKATLIKSIMNFANKYNLDGVDLDWEYPSTREVSRLTSFYRDLRQTALNQHRDMILSAAGAYYFESVPSEAAQYMDWAGVMAYQNAQTKGSQMFIGTAKWSMDRWNSWGWPKSKLLMGTPFYGYKTTSQGVTDVTKRTVFTYANDYAGMMIWDAGMGAGFGDHSLLDVMGNQAYATTVNHGVVYWSGKADSAWAKAANWTTGTVPNANKVAFFSGSADNPDVVLGSNVSVKGIGLFNAPTPITIGGNRTITLGSEGIDMTHAWQDLTIHNNIALGASQTWTVDFLRNLTVTGVVSGGKNLFKGGGGRLILTADNTYTGTTTINYGQIQVGNGGTTGSLGKGNVVNKGTLIFTRSNDFDVSNAFSGSGGYLKYGDGSMKCYDARFSGSNTRLTIYGGTVEHYSGKGLVDSGDTVDVYDGKLLTVGHTNMGANFLLGGSLGSPSLDFMVYDANQFATLSGTIKTNNPRSSIGVNRPDFTVTASNTISGSGGITKTGSGVLRLSGANTYTGGTTVNAGTLTASYRGSNTKTCLSAGRRVTVNSGATLRLAAGDALGYYAGNPNTLTINGGTMTVSPGIHSTIGYYGITLNGGTITSEGAGDSTGNYILDGGITVQANANPSTISARTIYLRGNSSGGSLSAIPFTVADGAAATDLAVSSVLRGPIGITKSGAGTMQLSGNNTYTGATTVNGGVLELHGGSSAYTYAGGNIYINNAAALRISPGSYDQYWFNRKNFIFDSNGGGTIDTTSGLNFVVYGGSTVTTNGGQQNSIVGASGINLHAGNTLNFDVASGADPVDLDVPARLWNSGGINKTGSGVLRLSGANTYKGGTYIEAGAVSVGADNNLGGGAVRFTGNGTLHISSSFATDKELLANNSGWGPRSITVDVNDGATFITNGNVRIYAASAGNVYKTGNGTWSIAAYSGQWDKPLFVNEGRAALLNSGAVGGGDPITITVADGAQAYLNAGGTYNNNFVIAGDGWAEKAGTLGAIRFQNNATIAGGRRVTLAGDARLTTYAAADTGTVAAPIGDGANGFGIEKTGPGTLILSGANSYTGDTTVSQGRLLLTGSLGKTAVSVAGGAILGGTGTIGGPVSIDGILSAGLSPGTLTMNNSLTLGSGSTSAFELASATSYDEVAGVTDITFGGMLDVSEYGGGPTYAAGQVFDLFDWSGSSSGTFDSINLPALDEGLQWKDFGGSPFNYATGTIEIAALSALDGGLQWKGLGGTPINYATGTTETADLPALDEGLQWKDSGGSPLDYAAETIEIADLPALDEDLPWEDPGGSPLGYAAGTVEIAALSALDEDLPREDSGGSPFDYAAGTIETATAYAAPPDSVPEPNTLVLLTLALGAVLHRRRIPT